jgi:hypothetical protein
VLNCDCGACFEVSDTLAGKEVPCPECQQPIKVPLQLKAPPRTSTFALLSAALALVGAFTVVGTLAAVLLGAIALIHIGSHPKRLKGLGFAAFGVVAGGAFTVLTLLALAYGDLFGLGGRLRELTMASHLDPTARAEDDLRGKGCSISRPSEQWGRVRHERSDDPDVYGIQKGRQLVLLNPQRHAYLDVLIDEKVKEKVVLPMPGAWERQTYEDAVLEELAPPRKEGAEFDPDDVRFFEERGRRQSAVRALRGPTPLPPLQAQGVELEGRELIADVPRGAQKWRFIVWIYTRSEGPDGKPASPAYVIRAYTPARRFSQNEEELRQALRSFRVTSVSAP